MKRIIRWRWFACFLSQFEWYRKLHGGLWVHVHVEEPCYSLMWLDCPEGVDETYREWNWRGTPEFRNYDRCGHCGGSGYSLTECGNRATVEKCVCANHGTPNNDA